MGIHEFEHEQQLLGEISESGGCQPGRLPDVVVAPDSLVNAAAKEYPPYPCNKQGQRIRHAVTGTWYPHLVGSNDEYRYFKVHDATRNNKQGCGDVYFFDSPTDYENCGGEPPETIGQGLVVASASHVSLLDYSSRLLQLT